MGDYIHSSLPTARKHEEIFLFDLDFELIEDISAFKVILIKDPANRQNLTI